MGIRKLAPVFLTLIALCATAQAVTSQGPLPLPDPSERSDANRIDLRTDANVRIDGAGKDDETGWHVADAGDVNGDGRADVIVGAHLADPLGRKDAGVAWVVFGKAGGIGELDLSKLGSGGFAIQGAGAGDEAGFAVSAAGDMNGDGLGDVIVGAANADAAGRSDAGAAYVVFGKASSDGIDLAALGSGGREIDGAAAGDQTGFAVARLGDVDGDNRSDLVVGSPSTEPDGRRETGSASVIFSSTGGNVDLAAIGASGYTIQGARFGKAGWSVAGLEDMNGDGRAEVMIGAPFIEAGASRSGAAFVVYGKGSTGSISLGDLGAGGFAITQAGKANEILGQSVAGAGDVNGDGIPDFMVSALHSDPNGRSEAGSAWVIFGQAQAGPVELTQLGQGGFRIDGATTGDLLGSFVGRAGDFNDDGLPDVLVGSPGASTGGVGVGARTSGGAGYVVLGKTSADTVDLSAPEGKAVLIAGGESGDRAGRSIARADLNGDAAPDVLIGAEKAKTKGDVQAGVAYGVLGVDKGTPGPGKADKVEIIPESCTPVHDIEAIIDDSGSMSGTDPDNLRVDAMLLLIRKVQHQKDTLGAVRFGIDGHNVFDPAEIGPPGPKSTQQDMVDQLIDQIKSDGAGTDYNAGFKQADKRFPKARARIFLTDGAHNDGEYQNGHRGGPPTYVLGFGDSTEGEDGDRLRRIANDTKAKYFPQLDADKLQSAMNSLDARLTCDSKVETWGDVIPKGGGLIKETGIDQLTKSADIVISWGDTAARFGVTKVEVVSGGQVVQEISAAALRKAFDDARKDVRRGPARAAGGLQFDVDRGKTFATVHLSGLPGGSNLRFRVRPGKLKGKVPLSTQVNQNRRNR